jgi:uncharacterized protein YaiI (UPF0178 family)
MRGGRGRRLTIWVDGDAMPGEIKDIILRAAQRLRVASVVVANKNVHVGSGAFVSFVRVTQGADVADAYIVEASRAEDFCITADIPLAAALVAKGLTVIDPRGDVYSEATVGERLAVRDFMVGLREAGVQTSGPPPFDAKAKQKFAARFDSLLTRALRARSQ